MGKDPAFLFYPGDWLGGTVTFTRHHKGAYMDLLMAQFNSGHLAIKDIKDTLGLDFESMWEDKLKSKFSVDNEGRFYNERLDIEITKRKNFTQSRRSNLSQKENTTSNTIPHMESHMVVRMENENENIIDIVNSNIIKEENIKEESCEEILPLIVSGPDIYEQIKDVWNRYNTPKVNTLSKERKDKIKTRIKEFNKYTEDILPLVEYLCYKISISKFCTGSTGWRATFDWLFENGKNWLKVAEGNYDNVKRPDSKATMSEILQEINSIQFNTQPTHAD